MKKPHLLQPTWHILRETITGLWREKIWRKAAAIAFYTLFATGPMLVLALHAARFLTDNDDVRSSIIEWLRLITGERGAEAIGELIKNFSLPKSGLLGYVIGAYMLFSGGINAIGQLRQTINSILKAEDGDRGDRPAWFAVVVDAGFVLGIALLVLASGVAAVMFYYLRAVLELDLPSMYAISYALGTLLSLVILMVALCCIYRYLPARKISWTAIACGSLVAAPLFLAVRFVLVAWFSQANLESVYGSISFMVVLLLWAYVSVQVALFGAAFAGSVEDRRRLNEEN